MPNIVTTKTELKGNVKIGRPSGTHNNCPPDIGCELHPTCKGCPVVALCRGCPERLASCAVCNVLKKCRLFQKKTKLRKYERF